MQYSTAITINPYQLKLPIFVFILNMFLLVGYIVSIITTDKVAVKTAVIIPPISQTIMYFIFNS